MGELGKVPSFPFCFSPQRIFIAPPRNIFCVACGDNAGLLRFLWGEPVTGGKHRHRCLSSWNAVTIKVSFDHRPHGLQ